MFNLWTSKTLGNQEQNNDDVSVATSRRTELSIGSGKRIVRKGKDIDCHVSLGSDKYHYGTLKIRGEISSTMVKNGSDKHLFILCQELRDHPDNYQTLCDMSFDDTLRYDDVRALLYQNCDIDNYYEHGHNIPQYMKLYIFSLIKRCMKGNILNKDREYFASEVLIKVWKSMASSDFDICTCRDCLGFDSDDAARYQLGLDCKNFETVSDEWINNKDSRTDFDMKSTEHNYFFKAKDELEPAIPYIPSMDKIIIDDNDNNINVDVMNLMNELGITGQNLSTKDAMASRNRTNTPTDKTFIDIENHNFSDGMNKFTKNNDDFSSQERRQRESVVENSLSDNKQHSEIKNPQIFETYEQNLTHQGHKSTPTNNNISNELPDISETNEDKEPDGPERDAHIMINEDIRKVSYEDKKNGRKVTFSLSTPDELSIIIIYPFGKNYNSISSYSIYSKESHGPFRERFIITDNRNTKYGANGAITFEDSAVRGIMICCISFTGIEKNNEEVYFEDLKYPIEISGMIQY